MNKDALITREVLFSADFLNMGKAKSLWASSVFICSIAFSVIMGLSYKCYILNKGLMGRRGKFSFTPAAPFCNIPETQISRNKWG